MVCVFNQISSSSSEEMHSVEQCFVSVQTTLLLNPRYVEVELVTQKFFKKIIYR